MNDETTTPKEKPAKAAKAPAVTTPPAAARVAKILVIGKAVSAKGFTFAKGATVAGVPLVHAEYLNSRGEARILEVG